MEVPVRSLAVGRDEMNPRTLGRLLAATALSAVLAFGNPLPAHAASATSRSGQEGLWSWVTGSWQRGLEFLLGRPTKPNQTGRQMMKAGGCIDPNGCANTQPTSHDVTAACGTSYWDICIDPNG